ncbi:MAG: signal peptide peptidase SppA [Firmicutes bacterium]|nr:signal peptide peptidase SppA [Bacillota bacterium]
MDDKVMDKDLKENLTDEIIDEAPKASGTPYWNGLERDPSGGYRFTGGPGSQNANGYHAYNMYGAGMNGAGVNASAYPQQKKVSGWVKALIIFLVVCVGLVGCGVACSNIVKGISGPAANNEETYDFRGDYIGVLYLEGTITDGMSGDGYDQNWILERIQQMTEEKNNRGIMLHVNTPGGSAYATSEVYKALLDYKAETGNPVYVYMGSQATSGGYYVAMAADKIYANPECWTGSIGVVVGTLYDLSGLMEKYGIKATNIVSGANKDMGSTAKPLTDEQLAILQSLVDDSFDRFVQAVVDGRGLSESKVRKLADGRIYTAKQALDGGLIDAIGTLDDALNDMMVSNGLENVRAESVQYVMEQDLLGMFGLEGMDRNSQSASGELGILLSLMESSNKVSIEFICPIRK